MNEEILPLRKQPILKKIWRVCYPIGIHFVILQIIVTAAAMLIMGPGLDHEAGRDLYNSKVLGLNAVGSLLVMIPILYLYHKDMTVRRVYGSQKVVRYRAFLNCDKFLFSIIKVVLLVVLGAALSEIVNIAVGMFANAVQIEEYTESVQQISEGKTLFVILLWMGILGPICEEALFRWVVYLRLRDYTTFIIAAILSGMLFGIYHGNLVQFFYASILGIYFACAFEWTGSIWTSVLLHIGANVWSILVTEYGETMIARLSEQLILMIMLIFVLVILLMTRYLYMSWKVVER